MVATMFALSTAILMAGSTGWANARRPAATISGERRSGSRPSAVYSQDPRFEKRLSLQPTRQDAAHLVRELADETGAALRIEHQFHERQLRIASQGRPAREIMDSLALLFHAQWVEVSETYVLVSNLRLARLTALSAEERSSLLFQRLDQLIASLTPEQSATLWDCGSLDLGATGATPPQDRLLQELGPLTAAAYGSPTVGASPAGFGLGTISGPDGVDVALWARWPSGSSIPLISHLVAPGVDWWPPLAPYRVIR
jgi:hypothetical protein